MLEKGGGGLFVAKKEVCSAFLLLQLHPSAVGWRGGADLHDVTVKANPAKSKRNWKAAEGLSKHSGGGGGNEDS